MKKSNMTKQEIDFLRNAVLFSLTRRGWSGRAKVRQSEMEDKVKTSAASGRLGVTKELIECESFNNVWECLSGIYNWCVDNSMSGYGLKKGINFVKRTYILDGKEVNNIERFEAKIKEAKEQLTELVELFINDFNGAKESAKLPKELGGLGELYREDDYPTEDELRESFRIEHSWFTISVPDALPNEVYEQECAKLRETFDTARTEMRYALREGFKELLEEAVDRLRGTGDYKGKKFRNDSLNAFNWFIETFNAKDITEDAELSKLVTNVRAIMGNMPDAYELRESDSLRIDAAKKFAELKKDIASMVEDKPKRKFATSED